MDQELLADQPLGHKLIKKWFWLYFFTLFIAPAGYFIRVIISNTISVSDVGIIYSILWFMGILSTYHDLWFTEALQYHLPKYRIQKQYNAFKTSVYLTLFIQTLSGLLIASMLFFWADYLALHFFHSPQSSHIIKIFCLYFLGINFFNMFYSIYIAFQDIVQYKLIEFIKSYTTLGFTLCFFLLGSLNITSFTWARIIGILTSITLSGIIFLKKYKYTLSKGNIELSKSLLRRQASYAFRVFIGTNIAIVLSQIDQQFVIYFFGPEIAGYYANYISLLLSFSIITSPLLGYIFPLTTELIAKNQEKTVTLFKNMLYKYMSLFAISVSGIFIVFGPEIATILFGKKFTYSWTLLSYSSISLIFYVLFSINLGFLAGMGKVKQRAKIIFITLIISIILNLVLIPIFGVIGVIIATTAPRLILFYLSYKLINKKKEIYFDWNYLLKNTIAVTIICGFFQLIKNRLFILNDNARYENLMYLCAFLIVYYAILWAINHKNIGYLSKEIKNLKKNII